MYMHIHMATARLRIGSASPTPALKLWCCLLSSQDRVQYPGSATCPSSIFSRVKLNIASKGSAPAPSAYVAVAFPSLCLRRPLRVLRSDVDKRKSSDVNKWRSSDKDKDKRKPRGRGARAANRGPVAERMMEVDNDKVQSAPMAATSDALIPEDALFLGFDSSTQSLKATVLDARLRLVHSESIQFDAALPKYATQGGVHRVTAPTLMWVEALDLLMEKLRDSGCPLDSVRAISGSGQQHGSVYWARGARSILQSLNSSEGLGTQLRNAFAINDSPIWMDSSTHKQCNAIEDAVGGPEALAVLTGSRAHERFTASQIRKIYETRSSFMASLLIGDYASIDHGDGGGMNLMDLKAKAWSEVVLKAVAPALEDKLGPLAAPFSVAGPIHPYFVER
ncbi:hypothetical protein CBR_g40751 [Chara braunii]|uniref:Carbohydrate kinase FGGY N-terminal domain-containing protein n=1 Tax=Chara braunii TaxID=69332 RepID=A0A388LUD9_CHABU|nr:hypothetical protein CBR_g40751 [Chara braunii]|eukprot:GBG85938.1 hypothetical protein CBR_g40751 [Chara braunii]